MHKSEVDEVNIRTAELWLYKDDSLAMLTHSAAASSVSGLLSAHTRNTACVYGVAAGGDEQSAEDHLAGRRDWETTGLPDVHSIKGREPCRCNVTFMSTQGYRRTGADDDICFSEGSEVYLCSLRLSSLQMCCRPKEKALICILVS